MHALSLPVPLYVAAERQLAMMLIDAKQVHDTRCNQKTFSRLSLQQVMFWQVCFMNSA